jgi:hypothetical protein
MKSSASTCSALVLITAFSSAAGAQESSEAPVVALSDAIVSVEESADSVPTLRISATVTDAATGIPTTLTEVEGDREQVYTLLLELAAGLTTDVENGEDAAEAEASALYALGQIFEARGYKDLAADAYQAVMKSYPEFDQAAVDWRRLVGRWELNLYGGLLNDEPEYNHGSGEDEFRRDAIFGVRGSYHFTEKAFVQAEVANALATLGSGGRKQNVNAFPLWGALGYDLHLTHDFQIFPTLGAGVVFWRPDQTSGSADFALSYGLGGRVFLTRNHALRGDMRLHHIPNALRPTLDDLQLPTEKTLWALELSFGVSWFPAG